MTQRLLNRREAAEELGVHVDTLRRWLNEGRVVGARRKEITDPRAKGDEKRAEWEIPSPVRLKRKRSDAWLTPAEARELTGLTYSRLSQLAQEGRIRYKQARPGATKYYSRRSLERHTRA